MYSCDHTVTQAEIEALSKVHDGVAVTGMLLVAVTGAKVPPAGLPETVAELSTDPLSISACVTV